MFQYIGHPDIIWNAGEDFYLSSFFVATICCIFPEQGQGQKQCFVGMPGALQMVYLLEQSSVFYQSQDIISWYDMIWPVISIDNSYQFNCF